MKGRLRNSRNTNIRNEIVLCFRFNLKSNCTLYGLSNPYQTKVTITTILNNERDTKKQNLFCDSKSKSKLNRNDPSSTLIIKLTDAASRSFSFSCLSTAMALPVSAVGYEGFS